MAGKSTTYSFASVSVAATLTDAIGIYPAGSPIDLTAQGFFDKTDNIVIEPMQEFIVDDIGPEGEMYPSVTGDESGALTINAADKTPLHQFLIAVLNSHRQGLNIKGVTISVRSRSVGGTSELLYQAKNGHGTPAAARKSFGSRQTGNSYPFRFEKVTHGFQE